MTKEIRSLSPKELKRLNRALAVVEKAYGVSDSELDAFFMLVKNAQGLMDLVSENSKAIESLQKALGDKQSGSQREKISKMMEYFSKPAEEINRNA